MTRARLTWPIYLQYWAWGILAVVGVAALCLTVGTDPAAHRGLIFGWPSDADILKIRLTRVATAALVGAALAASGVLLQALLRNPLADPYVLGISTGSSVVVLLWVIFGAALLTAADQGRIPMWIGKVVAYGEVAPALVGALFTCAVVFFIARANTAGSMGVDPLTLLLVGVIISAFNGALVVLLNSIAPEGVRADIIYYLIGHIGGDTSPWVLLIAAVVFFAGWGAGLRAAGAMNIASLSDTEATSLGLRLPGLRRLCFIAASVMTAAAIALARSIGFVGLICPHLCRLLFGPDHRQLLVTAPFCGAIFLMLADLLVQLSHVRIGTPTHQLFSFLPVGVITALAGGPFFLFILRHRNRWGGQA
jgi:iron complex transport system permease protein